MATLLPTFKALADESRLRLLRVLWRGSFNVNELVRIAGLGQSRVSRHLKILLEAGLVEARREGTWVYYTLTERWAERGSPLSGIGAALDASEELARFGDDEGVTACLAERRQASERFFRDVAGSYDARRDSLEGPQLHLERLVTPLGAANVVVDLGTGTGVLLRSLSERATRVIGVDAAPEMLAEARRRVASEGLTNVELRLGSLEHLPIPDQDVDAMVANMVLHHVAHPPDALREVRRCLRPGGRLVLADLAAHRDESYREKMGDLWLGFERRDLERWLADADLEPETFERIRASGKRPALFIVEARRGARRNASSSARAVRGRKTRTGRKERETIT